jgi:hypothetical protein
MRRPSDTTRMTSMKTTNWRASTLSSPKAWTDWTTPLRVMKVPKMVRKKVAMTRKRFQLFIIPRCSWMITECRNAVAVNHGRRPAFSTGSHAQ